MNSNTETQRSDTETVERLATSLGEAIANLPAYHKFLESKAAVEADEQAQTKIAEFERSREEYLDARERGDTTREDLLELQDEQESLHELPVMREYLQARNELELQLQALNERISDPLQVDFGEKAGGCCQN